MKIIELARLSINACEAENVDYMLTGAFATSCYGVPRSTKDVDLVLAVDASHQIEGVISQLNDVVAFSKQVQFDTITWGKRHVACTHTSPYLKVELFELFDDPFVKKQFKRRVRMVVPQLEIDAYLPTPEDVIVQKLRWARSKDLTDAMDVLAVQDPAHLDMDYIRYWCAEHRCSERLEDALAKISM